MTESDVFYFIVVYLLFIIFILGYLIGRKEGTKEKLKNLIGFTSSDDEEEEE